MTFTFIGTGSYPYWWYILLFLLIALLLFLLVLCIQLCWRFRPRLEMPQVREDVRNKGPHVIRDHMGMVRPRGRQGEVMRRTSGARGAAGHVCGAPERAAERAAEQQPAAGRERQPAVGRDFPGLLIFSKFKLFLADQIWAV